MRRFRKWFAWIDRKKLREVTERVQAKLDNDDVDGAVVKTLSLAIAHACFPGVEYGDRENMDAMLGKIRAMKYTPCEPVTAHRFLREWENDQIETSQLYESTWGMNPDQLIEAIVKSVRESS